MKLFSNIIKEAEKVFENVINEVYLDPEESVEFSHKDVVILGILENLIQHSQSILILIKAENYSSIDAIQRVVFENYVHLKFILKEHSEVEKRTISYAYSKRIGDFMLYDKLVEQTIEGSKLREYLKVSIPILEERFKKEERSNRRSKIESYFRKDLGMARLEQKWYNFDGSTKNFKQLCIKLDLETEYTIIYSTLSQEIHGKDAMSKLDLQKFMVSLKKPTNKDVNLNIDMSTTYLLAVTRSIYKFYGLTKKLKDFNNIVRIHHKFK